MKWNHTRLLVHLWLCTDHGSIYYPINLVQRQVNARQLLGHSHRKLCHPLLPSSHYTRFDCICNCKSQALRPYVWMLTPYCQQIEYTHWLLHPFNEKKKYHVNNFIWSLFILNEKIIYMIWESPFSSDWKNLLAHDFL